MYLLGDDAHGEAESIKALRLRTDRSHRKQCIDTPASHGKVLGS